MAEWRHHLELDDLLTRHNDGDEEGFEQVRDEFVARLRAAPFHDDEDEDSLLRRLVDNLADAVTPADFDAALHDLYDWADRERVLLCPSRTQACPPPPATDAPTGEDTA